MRIRPANRHCVQWGTLLIALVLAGCGRYHAPAPVKYGDPGPSAARTVPNGYIPPVPVETQRPAAANVEALRPRPPSGLAVVEPGDTLYRVSRRYGVALDDLARQNNLSPPYDIAPGQTLRLPRSRLHTVRRGETVYGLSRRFDVPQAALIALNDIRPPFRLGVGQKLKIPARQPRADKPVVTASLPADESQAKMPAPTTRAIPQPRRVSTIARSPPPRPAGAFRWPLRGKVLVGFGDRGKGLHNDGINIAAKRGAPVRAAENGVVTYSGNELRGFGNLVLLKHAGGWTTAYAHNSRLLVRTGQRVRRGQVIARVGSTGSVTRPQLHFELRRGDNAVDPIKHLKKRPRRAQRISRASFPAGRQDPG